MESPPEPFALEPSQPRHGRQLFARPLVAYVPIFGTQVRQIKNWVALGRELKPEALPPLDRPADMPAWWARAFPNRSVPEKIHLAAIAAKHEALTQGAPTPEKNSAPTPSPQKTGAGEPPANSTPRARIANFDDVAEMDLPAAVARQRRALAILTRDYESALQDETADESTLTSRANRVDRCIERLRKLEGTLDELRKSREELVEVAVIREELQQVHSGMAGNLEAELIDQLNLARATARAFVDRHFASLRQCRFSAGTEPRLPAAA